MVSERRLNRALIFAIPASVALAVIVYLGSYRAKSHGEEDLNIAYSPSQVTAEVARIIKSQPNRVIQFDSSEVRIGSLNDLSKLRHPFSDSRYLRKAIERDYKVDIIRVSELKPIDDLLDSGLYPGGIDWVPYDLY